MKVYFAFTIRGDRSKLEQGKEILKLLQEKGHNVLTTHVFQDNVAEMDGRLHPEEVFLRDMNWLQQADAVLVEASGSSFGVGFEAGFTLGSTGKKVYLVYDKSVEGKISRVATGLVHKNCIRFAYSSFEELRDFIDKNF